MYRADGYYKVLYKGDWIVARWQTTKSHKISRWVLACNESFVLGDEDLDQIGAKVSFKNEWLQGFICCICIMIRLDGMVETRTRESFKSGVGNTTLEELKDSIDPYDFDILTEHWDDLK